MQLDDEIVVDDATLRMLAEVSTNTLAGLMIKVAGLRTRIVRHARPLNSDNARFVGPAYTLRNVPIREDLTDRASMVSRKSPLHGTVDRIPPGSVLVIDMLGDTSCGGLGDIMVAALAVRGVVGLVTDGAMRDGQAIADGDLPVFCNGINPAPSNRALLAAGVQEMIGCGGVLVMPGDIVVGDADGVVIVPRYLASRLALEAYDNEQMEKWIKTEVQKGGRAADFYPPDDAIVARFREAQRQHHD